jgi:tetratricopeptide (TPR) repeat protein
MQHLRSVRRTVLLALSLLSACAASDPGTSLVSGRPGRYTPTGVFGNYLAGRFALGQADPDTAATELLKALAISPDDPELRLQAFIACLSSGRPEALQLARQLPDSQVGQLLLGNADVRAGRWQPAEQRFHALPRQGLTQLLQPLLIAWSQQGEGRADDALTTLRPFIESQRFKGVFALHAAMIADLANRPDDAARLYRLAQSELPDINLRLAQILASWQTRSGHPEEARATFARLAAAAPDVRIALPALMANATKPPVANAAEGIAEAYIALAAALRAQDSGDFAMIMARLALDLRPDFTAARLLAADIQAMRRHAEAASQLLVSIPPGDPIGPMVRLRQASLAERLGRTEDAVRTLERMAQEFPRSALPDTHLGDLLRAKQRFPEAVAAYDRAIARLATPESGDWVAFYGRGIAEERLNQWQKAEADFHRALELAPDQPLVLNYLGYSWADKGHNLDRAREMIQKAAERRPNDGAIIDSLGWVMFRQGAVPEAVKLLERAVELEPEDATINSHLGDAYWAVGRKVEAQYQWRRALTLNPAPDDAAKLEAKLKTGPTGRVISGP